MGLPQPLLDALRGLEEAERFDPAETFHKDSPESFRKKLGDLRGLVQDLETRPGKIREAVSALLPTTEQEIDQAIDLLFEHEESMRKLLPRLDEMRSLKANVFYDPIAAADKGLFVNLCDRWIRAFLAILAALRDLRWELIALRAEAEDPGDAPVFDNPQDLLGYLKIPSK